MKEKYLIFVANISSFLGYMLLGNSIYIFLQIIFGDQIQLKMIGTYCQLNDPDFKLSTYSLLLLLFFYLIKLAIIGITFLYFKKTENFTFVKLIASVILLNFIVFDFFSIISYAIDSAFNTHSFRFFFSGASSYMLETQIGFPRYSLIMLNAIIGFFIPFIVLKKTGLFNSINLLLYYLSLIAGIVIIGFINELAKQGFGLF